MIFKLWAAEFDAEIITLNASEYNRNTRNHHCLAGCFVRIPCPMLQTAFNFWELFFFSPNFWKRIFYGFFLMIHQNYLCWKSFFSSPFFTRHRNEKLQTTRIMLRQFSPGSPTVIPTPPHLYPLHFLEKKSFFLSFQTLSFGNYFHFLAARFPSEIPKIHIESGPRQ